MDFGFFLNTAEIKRFAGQKAFRVPTQVAKMGAVRA